MYPSAAFTGPYTIRPGTIWRLHYHLAVALLTESFFWIWTSLIGSALPFNDSGKDFFICAIAIEFNKVDLVYCT